MQVTRLSKIFIYLILLFLIPLSYQSALAAKVRKKNVLILHSYHKGLSWTDSITEGIEERFSEEMIEVDLSYAFMDTKRIFSEEYFYHLENLFLTKYRENKFDAIISSDDHAYQFLLKNGERIFGTTPIVFCGVNNFKRSQLKGKKHITGVQEDFDFGATIRVAMRLQDNISKVLVIGDRTVSGKANKEKLEMVKGDFEDKLSFEIVEDYSMEDARKRLSELEEDTIALWLHFTADIDGKFFTFEESSELLSSASNVPLYSTWDFHLNHGIVGGMITSGKQQGYTAASLALRVLKGERPEDIAVVEKSPNRYVFDYKELKRFGIDLERLPEGSSVINEPENLLVLNKEFILSIIGGFSLLSIVILLLTVSNIRRQRAEEQAILTKNKYLKIFNETNVGIMVEDLSGLFAELGHIRGKSGGRYRDYLMRNRQTVKHLAREITIVDANPAALELYGIDKGSDIRSILPKLLTHGSGNELVEFLTALLEKRDNYFSETLNRTLSGKIINVIIEVKLPKEREEFDAVLVSIIDITERKRAERALTESESRFRTAFNSAASGMALIDLDGTFQKVNRVMCTKLGFREDELIGMSWKEITHPSDIDETLRRIEGMFDSEVMEPQEKRYISKGGDAIWVLDSGAVIYDGHGEPVSRISQFQDITPRKIAEDKLMMQKERYRKYFEEDLSGVFVINHAGAFITCNDALREIFAIHMGENLENVNFFQFFRSEEEGKSFFDDLLKYRRLKQYEKTLKRRDGIAVEVIMNAMGRFSQTGKLMEIQGYVMDVTHQKGLEMQLFQAQKLESIGTMAGGIAHDFNNLLMGVLGNTSLLMLEKDESHPDYERLKNIEEYVKSGSSLTKQLLGFAKGGKYEVSTWDIHEILGYNSTMFRQTHKDLEFDLQLNAKNVGVDVDRSQIDQVMYNLYVNSWQAMDDGGRIIIRTTNEVLDGDFAANHEIDEGAYIRIEVEDNGSGIPTEILQRIFDPFFTTKEISRGTGLGLASSYGIIRNHSGIILVDSIPGKGACFTIYLPISKKSPKKKGDAKLEAHVQKGSEHILMVDDEEMILRVGCKMLEALGYTVHHASNGQDAVDLFQGKQQEINLVILDMIMPGMSGGETFDALRQIDPGVNVILSSGYSLDKKADSILKRGCKGFMQKPFDLLALSEKVRQVLDE